MFPAPVHASELPPLLNMNWGHNLLDNVNSFAVTFMRLFAA